MPDPAPAAPAPVAAAPTPTPTPPATPTPTPPPVPDAKPTSKELAGKLFSLLTADDPAKPPEKKDKPADTPPPTPPKPAPAATPPPTPEDGGIKRKKGKETPPPVDTPPPVPKKEDLNKPPTPAPVVPATPAKPEATDADFEKTLVDEERVLLEDARGAEKYLGDKYKGYGGKMAAFLKDNAKKLADPNFDAEDPAYQKWYNDNVPKIGALDFRRLERERVKEDVKQEFEPKIAEERHSRWVDTEAPKIKAKGDSVYVKLTNSSLPDDVTAAIAERTKGITPGTPEYRAKIDEVQKDYALEFEIAQNVINVATNDIEEFHRLTTHNPATGKPLTAFDPANPQHERLISMVTELCNEFKTTGGSDLKKDGKWFVTREEWQGMAPEQRGPFWTFTNEQLIERALAKVKPAVGQLVANEHKKLEARGFKRTIAPAAVPPPTPPLVPGSGAPPAPRPTPVAPGGTPQPSIAATLAGKLSQ